MKHESQNAFRREAREQVSGNLFRRSLTARAIASLSRRSIAEVVEALWPNDRTLLQHLTRAAVEPATTTAVGWAAELVRKRTADVLEALGPASGAADVLQQSLVLDWDGAGLISAPGFVASASNSSFVQEGHPIPVRQLPLDPAQLQPYKLATIAALTREMVESSNAEALISDALVRSTGLALDAVFFSANAATAAAPAGIRNGIAALGPSANVDPFAAVFEDVATLIDAVALVGGKGPFIFVAGPGRAASFAMRVGSADSGLIPISSSAVGNDLIVIAPKALVAAMSADPDVETANAATLVLDTTPGAAGTTASGEKEMWQTDSVAVKVRWPVSWVLRNPGAVAWLTPAWK